MAQTMVQTMAPIGVKTTGKAQNGKNTRVAVDLKNKSQKKMKATLTMDSVLMSAHAIMMMKNAGKAVMNAGKAAQVVAMAKTTMDNASMSAKSLSHIKTLAFESKQLSLD